MSTIQQIYLTKEMLDKCKSNKSNNISFDCLSCDKNVKTKFKLYDTPDNNIVGSATCSNCGINLDVVKLEN